MICDEERGLAATPKTEPRRRGVPRATRKAANDSRKRRKMKMELNESDSEDEQSLAAIRRRYRQVADPQKLLLPNAQLMSDRHQLDYVLDYDKNLLIRFGIRPEVCPTPLFSCRSPRSASAR